jgi:peptide chain release factor 1
MFNIEDVKKEYQTILEKLGDSELISNWDDFEDLTKRKSFLEKIIDRNQEIEEMKNRIEENKTIISAKEDLDLVSLAETEINNFQEKKNFLEEELKSLLEEEKTSGPKSIVVEIRAGTGGEEAGLFAADLFRMYSKYSQIKEWSQKTLDSRPTELGGFKEITFELKGKDVWLSMENEAGVHRVQRIPSTEKSGRIHTSTASVAVLPKPKKGNINIKTNDLKIDTYKASGPGGQYVNKRMTAIRITHLPTGIIVNSQNERSLQQNKENALAILEAKILKKRIEEEQLKLKDERKTQIGKAERSEKIRTYNFPQNRITDHRLQKSWHNLEKILDGELDGICQAFQKNKK